MKVSIGIDEVGRGPVAGPVTVGVFQIKPVRPGHPGGNEKLNPPERLFSRAGIKNTEKMLGIKLKDSKKLSRKQREIWFSEIQKWKKEKLCDFCVTSISAREIDRIGISKAIRKALEQSLVVLHPKKDTRILLDGGLKAPIAFKNQKTIIKGDEKEPVIALASIVAKVTRDRYMTLQAKKYPVYGFETNVGYGTKKQYMAIQKHGLTPLHRKTYLKKL